MSVWDTTNPKSHNNIHNCSRAEVERQGEQIKRLLVETQRSGNICRFEGELTTDTAIIKGRWDHLTDGGTFELRQDSERKLSGTWHSSRDNDSGLLTLISQ
jgi:hypothetical protein